MRPWPQEAQSTKRRETRSLRSKSLPRRKCADLLQQLLTADSLSEAEVERGQKRVWRINLTAAASIGFRAALWLSGFIYVPLTIHYLGPERYGLWVAMTSVMALLAFA